MMPIKEMYSSAQALSRKCKPLVLVCSVKCVLAVYSCDGADLYSASVCTGATVHMSL